MTGPAAESAKTAAAPIGDSQAGAKLLLDAFDAIGHGLSSGGTLSDLFDDRTVAEALGQRSATEPRADRVRAWAAHYLLEAMRSIEERAKAEVASPALERMAASKDKRIATASPKSPTKVQDDVLAELGRGGWIAKRDLRSTYVLQPSRKLVKFATFDAISGRGLVAAVRAVPGRSTPSGMPALDDMTTIWVHPSKAKEMLATGAYCSSSARR